ncbi:MAG: ribosome biogenesis GTPase YlqF [Bacilli bacterium]|jgi:ribosome biogenesis GTPase A
MENIHWFPGHMKRALREIGEKAKLVDLVVELRDARAVLSSANDDLNTIIQHRQRLIVLTKCDLANEQETRRWIKHFVNQGHHAVAVNLLNAKHLSLLVDAIAECDSDKRAKELAKGMKPQPLRIMVIGVPNVGKSTLINKLAKKKMAQVENRPGKTKAQQWIKVAGKFELLDTPGIMPMKFANPELAINLALLGIVKEDILPKEELAIRAISLLAKIKPQAFKDNYGLEVDIKSLTPHQILVEIAQRSGALCGGDPDVNRAVMMVLSDFRDGKLIHLSLETI